MKCWSWEGGHGSHGAPDEGAPLFPSVSSAAERRGLGTCQGLPLPPSPLPPREAARGGPPAPAQAQCWKPFPLSIDLSGASSLQPQGKLALQS